MKYALLIGINYYGTKSQLNGCINDINHVKDKLVSKLGFNLENIRILTDDSNELSKLPTGENIINGLIDLINKANAVEGGTDIWIHYSGHGSYMIDKSSDEKDGKDEVIVPLDYLNKGVISDDYLHQLLSNLSSKIRCTCFFDCCHSGTILDLKYKYNKKLSETIDNPNSNIKAIVFLISGCMDCQTSADYCSTKNHEWAGAMTTSFLKVLENENYQLTCFNLLQKLNEDLSKCKFSQIPQMSCSYKLNINTIFCNSASNLNSIFMISNK